MKQEGGSSQPLLAWLDNGSAPALAKILQLWLYLQKERLGLERGSFTGSNYFITVEGGCCPGCLRGINKQSLQRGELWGPRCSCRHFTAKLGLKRSSFPRETPLSLCPTGLQTPPLTCFKAQLTQLP